jgi:FtsP/CotA-like multicopper oxidase with cupredoxin domain
VESGGKTYLNPTIRARNGANVRIRLANGLGEETIVHWHGLHVDWRNDGHPIDAVGPGQSYDYDFTLRNRAATYWYHPHPHGRTGPQAYRGLAGLLIVEDEAEARLSQALDLEFGVSDVPLVIQDKRFDDRGQLVYLTGGPMEQFMGFFGDTVAVNLTVNPSLDVASRVYRFRLLNGSNARTYRLAFRRGNEGLPFSLIGTDGGFLAAPRRVEEIFLSPAERADVLLDLREAGRGRSCLPRQPAIRSDAQRDGRHGSDGWHARRAHGARR